MIVIIRVVVMMLMMVVVVIMLVFLFWNVSTIIDRAACRRRFNLAAELVGLPVVQHDDWMEPAIEKRIHTEIVGICRALKKPNSSENFELLATFVEINEAVCYRVGDRSIDHSEVGEECAQVRYRSVTDVLKNNSNNVNQYK